MNDTLKYGIIVIAVFAIILIIIAMMKKKEKYSSSLSSWSDEQKAFVKSKLDAMILCPDEDKDNKIAECVLKKLCKYDPNVVLKEFEIGENSDLVQDIMASCFVKNKCKLPAWIDEDKRKAIDLVISQDMRDKTCTNPDAIAKRAVCQVDMAHKLMTYEDMVLFHQDGVAPRPKIANQLGMIRGICYTNIPCAGDK